MNANTDLSNKHILSPHSSCKGRKLHYQDLITLFNTTFIDTENTVLVKGECEPIYLPANNVQQQHHIVFAHGYFASALHEISHWCIAGKQRRLLEDYGYWYNPDGRDAEQQTEFEKVEVKPQAIEWAFSCAAAKPFSVSTDNLNGAPVDTKGFKLAVHQQVMFYLEHGFPTRATEFIDVLQTFYKTKKLNREMFDAQSI